MTTILPRRADQRVHQLKRTLLYELRAREELRGRQGERGRRVRVPPDGRGAGGAVVLAVGGADAQRKIEAQMSSRAKAARATLVVENVGTSV